MSGESNNAGGGGPENGGDGVGGSPSGSPPAPTSSMMAAAATTTNVVTVKARTGAPPSMTARARRRREEAVRRLVADVQRNSRPTTGGVGGATTTSSSGDRTDAIAAAETHDWLVASTVATALEKGLDRDLHAELVQEAKDNAGRIGQVCHDHSSVFLQSVSQVAALGAPAAELADGLQAAQQELQLKTAGPMHEAATEWERSYQSYARAKTLQGLVQACQQVAVQLERARKQAAAGRPRAALDAVDLARTALTTPMESLFYGKDRDIWKAANATDFSNDNDKDDGTKKLVSLEQTPFGKRASVMLPKLENEVLMGAKRALNRWFLRLRSEGDGARVGRSVLRQCAESMAVGPGSLGLGGHLPPSYVWRAKTADNLISRVSQNGKVARASRMAYWFDRDAPKEAERLEAFGRHGVERKAETIASAFGWYRCWPHDSSLLVDPSEFVSSTDGNNSSNSSSLSGSRHGIGGSRHGLRGSRHGGRARTLGFRATTSSRSQAYQEITSTLGTPNVKTTLTSKWNTLLSQTVLYEVAPSNKKEEDETLMSLPESVHPVRRAELAFQLLGREEEFVQYYEQNRYGETKIGGGDGAGVGGPMDERQGERKSVLSSLTGDDVSVGNDRIFFRRSLPHLCASVVGFSAVEAAIELGNFADDDDTDAVQPGPLASTTGPRSATKVTGVGGTVGGNKASYLTAGRFRESSERYERALITELGTLLRARANRANLGELVRASSLLVAFRASLKTVHPGSTTRRMDRDLLDLNLEILMAAMKVSQEEQLQATTAIVNEDQKTPMLVSDYKSMDMSHQKTVPDAEQQGLPFGLGQMKQQPPKSDLEFQEQMRTSFNRASRDEAYTFSESVPLVMRSIHARAIAAAAFAVSQEELGQNFPEKRGSASAGFVLECVEECINVAAVSMKDSEKVVDEGSVEKAVQVMANIAALQHCLPRVFGTLMRGMCHIGLIRADEIDETFAFAESTLKSADKSCDAQVGSTYSLVYEICRNKIDSHINYALDGFQWVAKSEREMPNAYCEGLVGYLRTVFASLGPMDEGSRAGLHFSCCGHVSERLVKLLAGKPGDTTTFDDSGIAPITKIDAFGIKNLLTDCEEFERFAEGTGIPQLRDCFNELRVLTSVMLDKELPQLLLPDNAGSRRRKYPILSLEKVGNILEKYVGTGLGDKLMGGKVRDNDMLFIDKKEVTQLLKIVRSQVIS